MIGPGPKAGQYESIKELVIWREVEALRLIRVSSVFHPWLVFVAVADRAYRSEEEFEEATDSHG